MTISFCICTRGPAGRVLALLELVRPEVDEIVLAVDSAGDEATVDACVSLADRTLRFAYAPPPCRLIGWILRQCSCDWILRLDDDELPSAELLRGLRDHVADRSLTHVALTRRWLYPDRSSYIRSPPWLPDHQIRFVRNIPGLWRTTGRMHDGVEVFGDRAYREEPLYHADLLLSDLETRRQKSELYEQLRPGHLAEGVPVNAIYVPEDWAGIVTAPVPAADRALVDAVLDGTASPAETLPGRGEVVSLAEIDRYNTTRPVSASAYRARISFVRPVTRLAAGITRDQEVAVENLGGERWPSGLEREPEIRLGYRWLDRSRQVVREGPRTPLPRAVEPGESVAARLAIVAPPEPGRYVLEADIVHEHVRWFGAGARLSVEVEGVEHTGAWRRRGLKEELREYRQEARAAGLGLREVISMFPRWRASLRWDATPLGEGRPWVTFPAASYLDDLVGADSHVCEWGAGGSTLFFAERAGRLVTIESDPFWAGEVTRAVPDEVRGRWTLHPVEPELAVQADTSDPPDPAAYRSASPAFAGLSFRAYAGAIDPYPDESFDLVLVSGRARPSCVLHALPKVKPGGVLVLDHAERWWYGAVTRLAAGEGCERLDFPGPGPYAEGFWLTSAWRRPR